MPYTALLVLRCQVQGFVSQHLVSLENNQCFRNFRISLVLRLLLLLLHLLLLRSCRILILSLQSQAKFSPERAKECIDWIEEVKPPPPPPYFIFRKTFCSSRGTVLPSQFAPFCPTFNCWGKLTIILNLLLKVIGSKLEMEVKDQVDFGTVLKDGAVLCQSVSSHNHYQ